MKSFILLGVLASLLSLTSSAQTRKVKKIRKYKTGKVVKKTKVVKKVSKVRIFRSALDLLYIPQHHQFNITTGVSTDTSNTLRDYFVAFNPSFSQNQQVFSEEIDTERTRGFLSVDYAVMKNFVVGAKFANSFTNSIESANARNTGSSFSLYEEDNSGFDDPEIHALYRILRQSQSGFTIDILTSITIGVQNAQREEGDFDNTINSYRQNIIPSEALTQPGNAANGGTDIMIGARAGRKHSQSFEYMVQFDATFKTARDYEARRAFAQNTNFYSDLEYDEDAQFLLHAGGIGQFNMNDIAAIYFGADFYFQGEREINTVYPNTAFNERTDIEARSGFGGRLGLKFQIIPHTLVVTLEANYQQFSNHDIMTFVNNTESFRYTTDDATAFGGQFKADFYF